METTSVRDLVFSALTKVDMAAWQTSSQLTYKTTPQVEVPQLKPNISREACEALRRCVEGVLTSVSKGLKRHRISIGGGPAHELQP